jgi:hypothetical protein
MVSEEFSVVKNISDGPSGRPLALVLKLKLKLFTTIPVLTGCILWALLASPF